MENEDPKQNEKTKEQDLEFEKFKIGIEFRKWISGCVTLVIIIVLINIGFHDRNMNHREIKGYDECAINLILSNNDPEKNILRAHLFSCDASTDLLRKGLEQYYYEIDSGYKDFVKRDSVAKARLSLLFKDKFCGSDHHKK